MFVCRWDLPCRQGDTYCMGKGEKELGKVPERGCNLVPKWRDGPHTEHRQLCEHTCADGSFQKSSWLPFASNEVSNAIRLGCAWRRGMKWSAKNAGVALD